MTPQEGVADRLRAAQTKGGTNADRLRSVQTRAKEAPQDVPRGTIDATSGMRLFATLIEQFGAKAVRQAINDTGLIDLAAEGAGIPPEAIGGAIEEAVEPATRFAGEELGTAVDLGGAVEYGEALAGQAQESAGRAVVGGVASVFEAVGVLTGAARRAAKGIEYLKGMGEAESLPDALLRVTASFKALQDAAGVKPIEDEASFQVGRAIRDWYEIVLGGMGEDAAGGQQNPFEGSFVGDTLPGAVGSTGVFLAGGAAGQAMKLPAWVTSAALGVTVNGAGAFQGALDSGATEEEALQAFILEGPGIGWIEAVPIQKMLARANKTTGGGVVATLKALAKESSEEAIQEGVQTLWGNHVAAHLVEYEPDRELTDGLLESMAAGAMSAGLFSSAMSARQGAAQAYRAKRAEALKVRQAEAEAKSQEFGDDGEGSPGALDPLPEGVGDLRDRSTDAGADLVDRSPGGEAQEAGDAPIATQAADPTPFGGAEDPDLDVDLRALGYSDSDPEPGAQDIKEFEKQFEKPSNKGRGKRLDRAREGGEGLVPWLQTRGGIIPSPDIDLAADSVDQMKGPGFMSLSREKGMSLEEAMEAAIDEGFFPGLELGDISEADFLNAIGENASHPSYPGGQGRGVRSIETTPAALDAAKLPPGFASAPGGFLGNSSSPPSDNDADALASEPAPEESIPQDPTALVDEWLGNRQVDETRAEIQASVNENKLRELVPKRTVGTVLKEAASPEPGRQEARALDRAIHVYIDLKNAEERGYGDAQEQFNRFGEKLTPEQVATFEQSQALTPEQQTFAEEIISQNNALGARGLEADVLQNFYDNYTARLWEPTEEDSSVPPTVTGKFTRNTGRQRRRAFQSILNGWAAGRELSVSGAVNAQLLASQQIAQVIHDRNLIKAAKVAGLISPVEQDGWVQIEHPNFRTVVHAGNAFVEETRDPASLEVRRRELFADDDGNLFATVPMYAPKELGDQLNKILGSTKLRGPVLDQVTAWNARLKAQMLFTSLFHHQAFIRSFSLGAPLENTADALRVGRSYKRGREAIENYGPQVQDLVRGGMTIGRIQDFDELRTFEANAISKVIDKVPGAREIKNTLVSLAEQQLDFLFHRMGPNLKVMSGLMEYQHLIKRNKAKLESGEIQKSELAEIAANITNDDFGGLNLQKMRRDPTKQHIARLLLLAPDWTESNVRTLTQSIGRGESPDAYRKMWGRTILKGGLATVLWNYIMAGGDDEEFRDKYKAAWEEGKFRWLDVDVTPIYNALGGEDDKSKFFSIFGHFKDPIKWIRHPARSAKNKGSILGGTVLEALIGTDYAGRSFTTYEELLGIDHDKGNYATTRLGHHKAGDSKGGKLKGKTVAFKFGGGGSIDPEQLPSFLLNELQGVLPIQAQNAIGWLAGEIDGFDAVAHSVGMHTSTTYPDEDKKKADPRKLDF